MSFISVEPQSRVVLESRNNSLLAQFDTQLGIIATRYLAFFRERRIIEEVYIESLRELYHKAKAVDAAIDHRAEPTTTRAAWDKVRENLRSDADGQQAFIDILANDVIKPLEQLKESNTRRRNRAKDSLKETASCYANYAEFKVSKLQQAYSKKLLPEQSASSANVSQHSQEIPNKRASKVPALFRGRREDPREPEPAKASPSEEVPVSDDDCREAVANLNRLRLLRAENLGDGYDILEELVFTPTIKGVLVKYMDGVVKACAQRGDIVKSAGVEVKNALSGTDAPDLRASFRQALSFSTPPLTLYRNCRPGGYSNLIFGVPLVEHGKNGDNVPRVMRMCIEEVERRGLNIKDIYSYGSMKGPDVQKLRDRFESERSSSFTSTDDIYSVAALLKRYLWDLPDPLLALSLQDHRNYAQRSGPVNYTEKDLSLLRSKIGELHQAHSATLEALLLHLLRVASHSDKNGMTAKVLSTELYKYVFGGNEVRVLGGGINAKSLVMEDLIQNVHTLFNKHPFPLRPVTPSEVVETRPVPSFYSYSLGSSLSRFSSPQLPQFAAVQAPDPTPLHRPGLADSIPTYMRSSLSFSSGYSAETSPTALLTPISSESSKTLTEVETTTQERPIAKARSTEAIKTLPNSSLPDVVPLLAPTSVAEWRIHQLRFPPDPEVLMRPQSPPESVPSSISVSQNSSATSMQTRMWSP